MDEGRRALVLVRPVAGQSHWCEGTRARRTRRVIVQGAHASLMWLSLALAHRPEDDCDDSLVLRRTTMAGEGMARGPLHEGLRWRGLGRGTSGGYRESSKSRR